MSDDVRIFSRGLVVTLDILGKPYTGVLVNYKVGATIEIKIAKADSTLFNLLPNTLVTVRFISEEGMAYGFKTMLKNKKIPSITLAYPEEDLKGVSVRKGERVDTSFWAQLKLMKGSGGDAKLEMVGDANIVDMSGGGCRIITQQQFKSGDVIWVEFSYGAKDEAVLFKGIVRRKSPAPYESTYYGLQYSDLMDDVQEILKKIMENPID